jgi:hypothetical protein
MTVSVGGIALSEDLTLTGPINQPRVAMSARQTLGGRVVVQSLPVSAGRELLLATRRGNGGIAGTFTGAQGEQLAALRDGAQPVALVHHRGSFSVVILTIELEPINGVADPGAETLMVGTITMIEV